MSTLLPLVEHAVKKPIWDCRMCGQCVLHSTGMTCPMTCPKQLRNGPCGGVREDGGCEVNPEMRCVWLKAQGRAEWLPRAWREEFDELRPPVDNQLWGTSSWTNLVTGRDKVTPVSWQETTPEIGDEAGKPADTQQVPGEDVPVATCQHSHHQSGSSSALPAAARPADEESPREVQTTVVGAEAEVVA
ncbi:methylenetetrahydrofolate reductase C-terminal domain-containing protein [Lipingzhangella sp. LS1_29]|uniref:Methylenetetrahydrofolate reductase C-terminal domain-containing protein n=1 Tax=Lipingzhangella rawalii TaxID=2055835 RepID=A0ABU2H3M5_9ACTN|nr:methylenetetrahydrofolate reductase C-terminal domain-containing protein [Lipingzhangella rawalii]MDS1269597.1 methylenetetrahydrofolate reductase C-terminal domain-containing protein [Lipingzhangella rawalii]